MKRFNLFFIFPILSLSFLSSVVSEAKGLTSPTTYFNARKLSEHNMTILTGVSVLKPPNGFLSSLGKDVFIHIGYRRDLLKDFPIGLSGNAKISGNAKRFLHSIHMSSGIHFPRTNRKSPTYFSAVLGVYFTDRKKRPIAPYFEIANYFKIWQFSRRSAALVGFSVQYDLMTVNWWHTPSSINILTGLDINI